MLVVAKNAEEALLGQIRELYETNPTYRCLYLRCSLTSGDKDKWLPGFLHRMEEALIGESSQAYIFHDGDVLIVARSLTQKILIKILSPLANDLNQPALPQGLADLFEIGMDRHRIEALCSAKIENKKELQRASTKKKKEILTTVNREKVLEEIDKNLVASLKKRRSERSHLEVMVVEDDAFTQKLISNAMNGKYSVTLTSDGQGALLSYVTKAPDVLFLDIGLPDIDGLKVLERIFKLDPQAYVVMFSGNGSKEHIMRAVELGARCFVGKPFTKEKLFQYIEKSPFVQARHVKEISHGHTIA